jgi:cysteine-rich repeat protein
VQTRLRHVTIEDTVVGITGGSEGAGLDVAHTSVRRSTQGIQIQVGTPHLQDISIIEGGISAWSSGLSVLWGSSPTASRITIAGYPVGVNVSDSSLVLDNCVVQDTGIGVLFEPHPTRTLAVNHCTIVRARSYGVYVPSGSPAPVGGTATITNSIVSGNQYGVVAHVWGMDDVHVRFSDVWGNSVRDYWHVIPEPSCISANPQFVSDDDLRLRPGSVCIDTCPSGLADDRDGAARPANGDGLGDARWDMGAYEHGGTVSSCGNGVVEPGEVCDDGADNGEYGRCNQTCTGTGGVCGDGVVQGPEQCDDGNSSNDDACLNTCEAAACGDRFVHAGVEDCDDGNSSNSDACLTTCVGASCGDGHLRTGVEECDDGNASDTDDCLRTCVEADCGDGVVRAGVEA